MTSAEIAVKLAASMTKAFQDSVNRNDGDVDAALTGDVFDASYSVPNPAYG